MKHRAKTMLILTLFNIAVLLVYSDKLYWAVGIGFIYVFMLLSSCYLKPAVVAIICAVIIVLVYIAFNADTSKIMIIVISMFSQLALYKIISLLFVEEKGSKKASRKRK